MNYARDGKKWDYLIIAEVYGVHWAKFYSRSTARLVMHRPTSAVRLGIPHLCSSCVTSVVNPYSRGSTMWHGIKNTKS